tara:strand:- start:237 stop:434 length:198 start_codon:yes stop_codon:yes gene_type:complete
MSKPKKRLTIKQIRNSGWKPLATDEGTAWFGGKTHTQLSEYLPDDDLEDTAFEDIDFLVIGWKKS